ncbi:MAG TPA: hypothetical protein VGP07_08640 [Polyangia bacterium]
MGPDSGLGRGYGGGVGRVAITTPAGGTNGAGTMSAAGGAPGAGGVGGTVAGVGGGQPVAVVTGGSTGSGGNPLSSTGGSAATGGSTVQEPPATGGVANAGGSPGSGGTPGSGGAAGLAGSSGGSDGGGAVTDAGRCAQYAADYDAALATAKSCAAKDNACAKVVAAALSGCDAACTTHVDDDGMLKDTKKKWEAAGCVSATCALSVCISPSAGTCAASLTTDGRGNGNGDGKKGTCSDTLLGL